jgi:hypothetical protein
MTAVPSVFQFAPILGYNLYYTLSLQTLKQITSLRGDNPARLNVSVELSFDCRTSPSYSITTIKTIDI